MALIFVSYRTGDAAHVAAAVHERLVTVFGLGQVFRDARSMGPGERYPSTIRSALRRADVVVAVIGPQWLAADEHGQRLVDREWDWVRWEITTAVEFGIPIVPVLVDDTPLPDAAALPGRMAELARFQVARVRHTDQGADLDRLAAALVERVPSLVPSQADAMRPGKRQRGVLPGLRVGPRALGISIGLIVALVSTGVMAFVVGQNSVSPSQPVASPSSSAETVTTSSRGTPGTPSPPPTLRLLYPDPNANVTDVPQRITVKVKGQLPDDHLIWTGARAIDETGASMEPHSSLLWTTRVAPDVWETMQCFGLGNEAGKRFDIYAYLVPRKTHDLWLADKKNGPSAGFLRRSPFELQSDGASEIGKATVRLTADPRCHREP